MKKILFVFLFILGCADKDLCGVVYPGTLEFSLEHVPADSHKTIKSAAKVWNKALGAEKIILGSGGFPIYWQQDWKHSPTAIGITSFLTNDYFIFSPEISINAQWYDFELIDGGTIDNPEAKKQADLYSLMIHEFGHALGIRHVDDSKAVMYPYANGAKELTETDLKQLYCRY